MADDLERALAELVRHEVEAALIRHGIGREKATEVARAVSEGISLSKTSGVFQCPQCGYDVQRHESWSDSVSEGESTSYGTSHTESSAESSGRSRSRSITSQSTTEGTTETETGTESVSGSSYPERGGADQV